MIRLLLASLLLSGAVAAQPSDLSSFEAFRKAAAVLRHPRCLNCHVPGDQPLSGPKGEPHPMRVERGPDGRGMTALHCGTCHQESNGELPHSPPGARDWRLPPPESRLAWVGLDDRKLCNTILGMKTNGKMPRDKIVEHVTTDSLVLWGFDPGPGREAPPMSHREFVELIRVWIEKGASCAA